MQGPRANGVHDDLNRPGVWTAIRQNGTHSWAIAALSGIPDGAQESVIKQIRDS